MQLRHVHIIMYHYVRDLRRSRYPGIKGLDVELFRRQLDFLMSRFTIIRMEDLLAALDGSDGGDATPGPSGLPLRCEGGATPGPSGSYLRNEESSPYRNEWGADLGPSGRSYRDDGGGLSVDGALLTFDDGYIDIYEYVFPLLEERRIQGSFFPPSMILETAKVLDVNKIHFTLAVADEAALYDALIAEIDFYRGSEFCIPRTDELLDKYAVPNRFDCGEIIFIKRMLQTVLPEGLRSIILDKLFKKFVGVDEAVFARELYCDAAQLASMKRRGMYIGLHGHAHGWLGNMEKNDYEQDIRHALDYMDSIKLIDKGAWVMNYPYGSWNDGVVDCVRSNGGLAGITTEVAVADLHRHSRLLLPRLDTNDYPPISERYKHINHLD